MTPIHRNGPTLIAVASGKGGVGKTWFAITLAQALGRLHRKVLLVDGDFGLANVDVQLGLAPVYDLGAVLTGRVPLARAVAGHDSGGFDILPGRSGSGALSGMDSAAVAAAVKLLRTDASGYDIVLLDLCAGVELPARQMAARADLLLVVVTDEPTSLTDAYAVLKLFYTDRPDGDARLVINQAATRLAGERTHATLLRACVSFLRREPKLAGIIRRDDRVRDAIRRQTPLLTRHPGCAAAVDVETTAAALMPLHGDAAPLAAPG
jgi:flagellar biosynthesis protein FlhG